jgi:hypothetical protein
MDVIVVGVRISAAGPELKIAAKAIRPDLCSSLAPPPISHLIQ